MRSRRDKDLRPLQGFRQFNTLILGKHSLQFRQVNILFVSSVDTKVVHETLERRYETGIRGCQILEHFQLILYALVLESVSVCCFLAVGEGGYQGWVDD